MNDTLFPTILGYIDGGLGTYFTVLADPGIAASITGVVYDDDAEPDPYDSRVEAS